jgi:hypothetical protein
MSNSSKFIVPAAVQRLELNCNTLLLTCDARAQPLEISINALEPGVAHIPGFIVPAAVQRFETKFLNAMHAHSPWIS